MKEIDTVTKLVEIEMPQFVWDDVEVFIKKLTSDITRPLALGTLLSGGVDAAKNYRPEAIRPLEEVVKEINEYKFNTKRR